MREKGKSDSSVRKEETWQFFKKLHILLGTGRRKPEKRLKQIFACQCSLQHHTTAERCPSVPEGIHKVWSIHTLEYYLAIQRNEGLAQATTWMNLENMTLSERNQMQKDKYHMIPFI